MTKEELMGAVARGWCHENNSHKEMDVDLAMAIVDEVLLELDRVVLTDDDLFDRIWQATKHWDLNDGRAIDGCTGYAGMTGDDVRVIMDAIAHEKAPKDNPEPVRQEA